MENRQANENQQVVMCKTKDDQLVGVPVEVLRQSNTFKTMIEDMGMDLGDPKLVFPVSSVSTTTLHKCMEWCQQRIGVPDPVVTRDPTTHETILLEMSEQDKQFFKVEFKELENLLWVASYLDIRSLYTYACQVAAAILHEKCKEGDYSKVRELLEMEDDLTEEEKQKIMKENIYSIQPAKK